jgi:Cu/Ag efflux protein CusF
MMLGAVAARFITVVSTLVIAASTIAHIHGRIVSIDEHHGTFFIHHDPFAAMPMAMTMEVQPKHRADLQKLHVGETIDATIDTSVVPWPATDIRPARGSGAGNAQRP